MQVSLAGKTAIVTGAASGVGLATSLQFVGSGLTNLIAVDRSPAPPELQALLDRRPQQALFVPTKYWDMVKARFTLLRPIPDSPQEIVVSQVG